MHHSCAITRKSASIWLSPFVVLPRAKRNDMAALYAFCREVDDVADGESAPAEKRREQLAGWRVDVRRACEKRKTAIRCESGIAAGHRQISPVVRAFR